MTSFSMLPYSYLHFLSSIQGLCYAIPGPTLLDLQLQTKVDLEEISSIFTGRSFGYLIGSLVGGFMFDRLNGLLLLSFALFMASVATIIAPWAKHFMLLLGMIGLQGASLGVMDTGMCRNSIYLFVY